MKNLIKIAILSSSIISSLAFAADSKKYTDSSVVAEFNGEKVTLKEVMAQFKEAFEMQPAMKDKKFEDLEKAIQENMIKSFLTSKAIEKEAMDSKIFESAEYKEKLEKLKTQLAQQIFIEGKIKTLVTDSAMNAEYEKLKKELTGKEEAKASHILVADEAKAKEVKAKLDKGGNFAELAKKYSSDEGSKANGGDIGYFRKGMLVPEFEAKAFSMKKGEISAPVKTQFGYHIIKLEDKRAVKVPSFEEVKQQIESKLSREIFEKYISEIEAKYNIKVTL